MKVEVESDKKYSDTKIIIYTNKTNEEITELVSAIENIDKNTIKCYKEDKMYILNQDNIESVYSENGKNYIRSGNEIYLIKNRLYILEELLNSNNFVRISKSEIANFDKVKSIDFKISGTLILNFKSGNYTYVSRRYINKIKEFLNI